MTEPPTHAAEPEEPGDEEEEDMFEVDEIIDDRIHHDRRQFLLRWKSFDSDEASWEYEDDMNCQELIDEYKQEKAARELAKQKRIEEAKFGLVDSVERLLEVRPNLVIAAFRQSGVLYYRIACAGNQYRSVEADLLRKVAPKLICDFLENKIKIC
jgi:hypothetical protein